MLTSRRLALAAVLLLGGTVALFLGRRDATHRVAAPAADVAATAPAPGPAPAAVPAPAAASAPPTAEAAGGRARGEVVVRGTWGSAPGQFGRRREAESSPEGPMALWAGAPGELLVLDQINRRVERYRDGRRVGGLLAGGDTMQDLAVGPEGRVALLDRFVDKSVQVYSPDGKLQNEVTLAGAAIPEPGLVTGVFADSDGFYVEREHGTVVRIADGSGASLSERQELPGRPSRDGHLILAAALLDRAAGTVRVRAFQRATLQPLWERAVQLEAPVLHILLLDSDRSGRVYVAAAIGHEDPNPPYKLVDESITAVRLDSGGSERGRLHLPPLPDADEAMRPLAVDDSGDLFVMAPTPQGLELRRYRFP
ncbi:MAG: hypothetical protein U1A78_36645 [Polyangia bacterium]